MFDALRARIARLIAPGAPRPPVAAAAQRMYHAARMSRLTEGWGNSQTSADAELHTSLPLLRSRSRQLVRDAGYAKRAKVIVQNNVIGGGIGLQAQVRNQRRRLLDDINTSIEEAWAEWARADRCHTGGKLHFHDLERLALGEIFESGEFLARMHMQRFGDSAVPFALEVIEAERIADQYNVGPANGQNRIRMGIEVDSFDRPVAYWLRTGHPGDLHAPAAGGEKLIRVPAEQILHLYVVNRWPQSRGEPWLHAAARRLNDLDGYSEAEIVAARNAACYMGFITSPDAEDNSLVDTVDAGTGQQQTSMEPGMIQHLRNGESFEGYTPTRPNAGTEGFMRAMLREIAASVGVSYESLSRDYAQSNYSSSRLALLDDRDLWRILQQWWIRAFRMPIHRAWLKAAVYSRAVGAVPMDEYLATPAKFEAVRFKPRGWTWIDPTKEVEAAKAAVQAGFTTVGAVIDATNNGMDLEDTLRARRDELDLMDELDLHFDTSVLEVAPAAVPARPAGAATPPSTDDGEDDPEDQPAAEDDEPAARVYSLRKP